MSLFSCQSMVCFLFPTLLATGETQQQMASRHKAMPSCMKGLRANNQRIASFIWSQMASNSVKKST